MTNEEAIEILQSGAGIWPMTDRANNALNKAIKALSQQTEYHGTEDMDGLYYCPICQQTTTVVKDGGKCPKCGATMDELSTREQTEDAISRKAAIFLTDELKHDLPDDERLSDMVMARNEGILEYQTQISLLPSVNPQPKTGHWIEQDGFDGDTYYDCSECGESFCLIDGTPTDNLYNYCPNCGAKMESEEQA